MDENYNFYIASFIAENAENEQDAIKGYYNLLMSNRLENEDVKLIKDIIAEEKKHAFILAKMAMKYDSGIKAEALPDGLTLSGTIEK